MKRKIFTYPVIVAVLLSLVTVSFAKTEKVKKTVRQTNSLAAELPVSDAAAVIDLQRLLNTALPQILNAKPQTLTVVNAKIDEVKNQTSIDLRQFEQVAVGVNYRQTAPKKFDLLPVALARGKYNADALLTAMKLAAGNKFREEKVGAKTIYIFAPREIVPNNNPQNNRSIVLPGLGIIIDLDKIFAGEIAVAAFDDKTLAFGKLARVRETLEGKSRIAQNILALVNRNPNVVISFGGNVPTNFLAEMFNLTEDDEIGKNINSIRQMYGSLDAADGKAIVAVTAKTTDAKQAEDLETTVSGFQMLGKSVLGGMRGDDKKIYARMAENAKITREGSEVMLNLQVPQSDIDVLLGKK